MFRNLTRLAAAANVKFQIRDRPRGGAGRPVGTPQGSPNDASNQPHLRPLSPLGVFSGCDPIEYLLAPLLCVALAATGLAADAKKKIVLIAGKPSHGYGAHEHNAGCDLLGHALKSAMPQLDVEVIHNGWPQDEKVLDGASTIVMYCDGGGGHMVLPHKKEVDALAKKGSRHRLPALCRRSAQGERRAGILGLDRRLFRDELVGQSDTGRPSSTSFPDHPITRGVKPFAISDEWYYHMRFRPGMQGVTPILTTLPPASTLVAARRHAQRQSRRAPRRVGKERAAARGLGLGKRRGRTRFRFYRRATIIGTGVSPNFRKLVLNAIVWTAQIEVPSGGVRDPAGLDRRIGEEPGRADPGESGSRGDSQEDQPAAGAGAAKQAPPAAGAKAAKPIFASQLVSKSTPGHAVDIDVDIKGPKQLYLVVSDGGDGFACRLGRLVRAAAGRSRRRNEADRLEMEVGRKRLGQRPRQSPDRRHAAEGRRQAGRLRHRHARQQRDRVRFAAGLQRFKARGGLDEGGSGQPGSGSTVTFAVYRAEPRPGFDEQASARRRRGRLARGRATRWPVSTWPRAARPRCSPASRRSRTSPASTSTRWAACGRPKCKTIAAGTAAGPRGTASWCWKTPTATAGPTSRPCSIKAATSIRPMACACWATA